ncbi:MAG: putative membrane protein YqgA involved in biofilm formation [Saprospiraceae bacterium]|jgi:uncharacterized membrane protein YqgA involved in biofilm formation|tara:strand:+ start:936 stop:1640 length:705 start_codon:yes stop_codon:yes gene_type:complete
MKNLPIGTVINVVAVIIGGLLGLFLKQFFTTGMESIIFQALGLGVILIGLKMALKLPDGYMLVCIFSLVLGGIVGELIQLDGIILSLSERLKSFSGSSDSSFSEGLITAFLLFCIGSMTIVGAIEEGLNQKRELLIIKSTLDGFSSIALAATLGVGVLFSVIPLLIFQGGLTMSAKKLKPLFDKTTIDVLSSVGGILILGISMNLLGLGDINLENLLPALVLCIILSKIKIWRG